MPLLPKVLMKQIKPRTQASLCPTPKRVNIVQNSIYRENSRTVSPKTPRNSEGNTRARQPCPGHSPGFPGLVAAQSFPPPAIRRSPVSPSHATAASFTKKLGNRQTHLILQKLSWICPTGPSARAAQGIFGLPHPRGGPRRWGRGAVCTLPWALPRRESLRLEARRSGAFT